jgi:signal transduction histidine kinase
VNPGAFGYTQFTYTYMATGTSTTIQLGFLEPPAFFYLDDVSFSATSLHAARIRSEEALRRQARAKDQFLAVLAHELRTPLATIRNGLEVLRLDSPGSPNAERMRTLVDNQARHMGRLVGDLLDASRINQEKVLLCKKKVDLIAAVTEGVETVRPLIQERRHELTVSLPPGPLELDADPTRLAQIIVNLLTNAAKYTEPGSHIGLRVEHGRGEAVLRVRDTGIGLAPDMLPSIFDLFMQAKSGSQGGLGIGLHLVQGLVRLHGGIIAASSDGLGQGSEFVVRLPLPGELPSHEPADRSHCLSS